MKSLISDACVDYQCKEGNSDQICMIYSPLDTETIDLGLLWLTIVTI